MAEIIEAIPEKYRKTQQCEILNPSLIARGLIDVTGTMNVEVVPEGVVPAFDHGELTGSSDRSHFWGSPIVTKNPAGNPRIYAFANRIVFKIEDGAIVADITFDDVVQGLFVFADSTDAKRLIAWFGNSTAHDADGGHWWRNLTSASDAGSYSTGSVGPWAEHSGATALTAFLVKNYGPDGYIVTSDTGKAGLNEWKLRKIVQGIYDGSIANSGAAEPVGSGDWPIIGLAMLRNAPVVGTGAGAFIRNTVDKFYEPLRPLQENLAHGLNNKVMVPCENGVVYSDSAGKLFETDGSNEIEITPPRMGKDIRRGRIEFAADRGDVLAVGHGVGGTFLSGPSAATKGIRVFTRIAGTWAEITSGVTDGSLATPASANMNAWGGTATDRLLFMSPVPLWGMHPYVTRNPNGNTNSFTNPQGTSTGAETAGSLSVDLGTVIDTTILGIAARSLVLVGLPPAASEPLLSWDNIQSYANVGRSSALTITGIAGSPFANMYAYEFSPTNTTAMTATTTIDEIDFILARPGFGLNDTSGPFTQANDFSSLWASGMLSEIDFGSRRRGIYDWSTPYTLYTKAGGAFVATWSAMATGTMTNGGQPLIVFYRAGQFVIAEGLTRNPLDTKVPRLCQWTTTEPGPNLALNDIRFVHSDGSPALPLPKRITGFIFDGRNYQTADQVKPLVNYRTNRGWSKFAAVHGPLKQISRDPTRDTGAKGGDVCDVRVLISDGAQTDFWPPLLTRIAIEWEYTTDAPDAPLETVPVD